MSCSDITLRRNNGEMVSYLSSLRTRTNANKNTRRVMSINGQSLTVMLIHSGSNLLTQLWTITKC